MRTKNLSLYIIAFIASLAVMAGLLFVSAAVPQSRIQENMEESAEILCEHNRIWYMIPGVAGSQNHLYADAITLNIAYHLSDGRAPESVMWAKYYTGDGDVNTSLRTSVRRHLKAETQYLRYWHGSSAVVRILHVFLNIRQIYWLHAALLTGLLTAITAILLKKRLFAETAAFLLSMILISIWFVPFCLEYTWTFLCMLIASIIGIKLAADGKKAMLYFLFLITGMITVYLDFLSTETLTLVVPLILILRVLESRSEGKALGKERWIFALKSSFLWSAGYIGMWVSKWIIASAVLHENVMPYVSSHINDRIGGANPAGSLAGYIAGAIIRNIKCLLPFDYGIPGAFILLVLIFAFVIMPVAADKVRIKKKINRKMISLYLIIGGIPILRFAVLHSHSWYHRCFTYRALAGTLLAMYCIAAETIEWKRLNVHI